MSRTSCWVVFALSCLSSGICACSGTPAQPPKQPAERASSAVGRKPQPRAAVRARSETTPKAISKPSDVGATGDNWTCGGELVPPTGWQQETAFETTKHADARERARDVAIAKLIERLCAAGDGVNCGYLKSRVQLWKTGSNGDDVCAMAVIKSADFQEWNNLVGTTKELDSKLEAAAVQLLKGRQQSFRFAIDTVKDLGVPGGLRADWLRARMERALQKHATMKRIPKGWAGDGVPPGIDAVARCEMFARQENSVPTLEAVWNATDRQGQTVTSDTVTFPESAAPPIIPAPHAPATYPESEGISVRLDTLRGGSICAGERTQLWLKSKEQLYVRVFNLYGNGEALVLFPNNEQAVSLVPANRSLALGGPMGFEAVPVPGSEQEQFLVIGARSEAALGRFIDAKGPCRVTPDMAQELYAAKGISDTLKVATTGYRLTSGSDCPPTPATAKRDGVARAVKALPICSF
jgi:hypothetical protein